MARPKKTATAITANDSVSTAEIKEIIPKEIDLSMYIPVRNGYQGTLIYKSKRTDEDFVWNYFGDTQDIELRELRNAKSSAKVFFEQNWFMFDDEYKWVISYLGMDKFYKNSINLEDFDEIFELAPNKIKEVIGNLPDGQRSSVAFRARQLVSERAIDSLKVISALEEALGIELIEK